MTVQDFDSAILALAAWREAQPTDPVDAMLCIALTIVNLSRRYDLSIGEAIVRHQELHGVSVDYSLFPDTRDPRFMRLIQRIGDVTAGYIDDMTGGALYYVDLSKPHAEELDAVLESPEEHPMCAVAFGRHFYK